MATFRRSLVFVLLALFGAAIIFFVTRREAPKQLPTSAGVRGGTIVSAIRSEPRSFNRFIGADSNSDLIAALAHGKLVRINRVTQDVEPWLAERWEMSADGLAATLTLRPGITFSDGAPFTSADVLFSFRAIYDEKTASPSGDALRVGGKPLQVEAPDPHSVVVRFPSAYAPGVRILDNLTVLPRHRLEQALQAGTLKDAWGVTTPPAEIVGLGPFVLTEYVSGQRIVFARNPRFWMRDERGAALPYLDRVVLQIIPDLNAEILQLEAGNLDLIQDRMRPEDVGRVRQLAGAGRLQLLDLGVALDADFFWINLNPASMARDPRRAWIQHVDLRRAIAHAVDRQAFANTVYLGAAVPIDGPVTPGNKWWHAGSLPSYAFDRARARALLAGLGLGDRNGDGMLEDGAGTPARFSLLVQKGHTVRERAATVLQEDLRQVGIGVDVITLEFGALIKRFQAGDYEAMYFGQTATDVDPAVNLDYWLSSGGFHAWHPNQPAPVTAWERRIDELMLQQVAAQDLAERKRIFADVQRIFAEQVPALYFAAPRVYVPMGARVIGARPGLIRPYLLWSAETLSLRTGAPGPGY